MSKAILEAASFTGKDITDILENSLKDVVSTKSGARLVRKTILNALVEKAKQNKPAKIDRKTPYTKALEVYKTNLREIRGGITKGRPFTEQVESALARMTSEELKALELGRSNRFRKEAPASMVVSMSENVASLRN